MARSDRTGRQTTSTGTSRSLSIPLRVFLFLTFAWGVIAFGVGINAIVKGNDEKAFIREHAPLGAQVNVNTNDIVSSGGVVSASSIALALTALLLLLHHLLSRSRSSQRPRTLLPTILTAALLLFTLLLLASLIPYTLFFARRSAGVSASIDGVPVPSSVLKLLEGSLGVSTAYNSKSYLRLLAILPWITFLVASITTCLAIPWIRSLRRSSAAGMGAGEKYPRAGEHGMAATGDGRTGI